MTDLLSRQPKVLCWERFQPPPLLAMHIAAVCLIVLYLWPYWLLGQDAHVLVHDQLDSVFISLKVLAESGLLFAHPDTPIPAIGNDIPRVAYPSPFYGVVWLFKLLGAFEGYVAAQFLLRLIAYWGMYRLLSRYFLTAREHRSIAAISGLAFACLPHYSLFGLSIAGYPLFFSGLLAIRAGNGKTVDWCICLLYPVWSLPALGGMFAMIVGGILWCFDLAVRRPGARQLFWALALAALATMVVEYQVVMILLGLADGFVSHRTEFQLSTPDIGAAFANARYNFKYGQYHSPSLQSAIILPGAIAALGLAAWSQVRPHRQAGSTKCWRQAGSLVVATALATLIVLTVVIVRESPGMSPVLMGGLVLALALLMPIGALILPRYWLPQSEEDDVQSPVVLLMWCLTAALALSLWYAFWPLLWPWAAAKAQNVPYLNLSRFHYLHPMLWAMVLAAVLAVFRQQGRIVGAFAVTIIVAMHTLTLLNEAEHRHARKAGDPTFREFFSPALFHNLSSSLEPGEHISAVVSIGLHPSIAAYNGLHTLDGYLANYPLSYKRAFRSLIAGELDRNQNYQKYFDDWGSRFYVFSDELALAGDVAFALSNSRTLEKDLRLDDLRFYTPAFIGMGGSHVLSAVAIGNAQKLGLELVSVSEHPSSPWRLHFYRVAGERAGQQSR